MKRIITSLIFATLLFVLCFGLSPKTHAQPAGPCEITEADFVDYPTNSQGVIIRNNNHPLPVLIKTRDCTTDDKIELMIYEQDPGVDDMLIDAIPSTPVADPIILNTGGTTTGEHGFVFNVNERGCGVGTGSQCDIYFYFTLTPRDGGTVTNHSFTSPIHLVCAGGGLASDAFCQFNSPYWPGPYVEVDPATIDTNQSYGSVCEVNASFDTSNLGVFDQNSPPTVNVNFQTRACSGRTIKYEIRSINGQSIFDTNNGREVQVTDANFSHSFKVNEELCVQGVSPACEYAIWVLDDYSNDYRIITPQQNQRLTYNCSSDGCQSTEKWLFTGAGQGQCEVKHAFFEPKGLLPTPDENVTLTLKTFGCEQNDTIGYRIVQEAGIRPIEDLINLATFQFNTSIQDTANWQNISGPPPVVEINYKTAEELCSTFTYGVADCFYRLYVIDDLGERAIGGEHGHVRFECSGQNCNNQRWEYLGGREGLNTSVGNVDLSSVGLFSNDPNDPCNTSNSPRCYAPLQPLPGLGDKIEFSSASANGGFKLGDLINTGIQLIIGLLGILAVLMIVWSGVQYMFTDIVASKGDAKERIQNALLGLLIALGAYILLVTINPDLVNLTPEINSVDFTAESTGNLSPGTFENITGTREQPPETYQEMARVTAAQSDINIDYCVLETVLKKESAGKPSAIGQDESVTGTRSQSGLKASAKTYKGAAYTEGKNDNFREFTESDDLGLDWRFSQGIGLTQITFFPVKYFKDDYKTWVKTEEAYNARTTPLTRELGGVSFTPKQLLNPETNIEAGARLWKTFYEQCNSVAGAFSAYNSGSCNNTNNKYTRESMSLYNACCKEETCNLQ